MQDFVHYPVASSDPEIAPLTTAFLIVESEKGVLLVYNKYRCVWELPGGMIEAGESPADCAMRECKEESGQTIREVQLLGYAKLLMKQNAYRPEAAIEYSALFAAHLEKEEAFLENEETTALRWWTPGEALADFCVTSQEMIALYRALR